MLGAPGAGKGTQADRIARSRGLRKISTGDILRAAYDDYGDDVRALLARGEFVPDEVAIGIVDRLLKQPESERGFVLDGFPRTVPQAEALDRLMVDRGDLVVVDIAVPENELVQRLSRRLVCAGCGRPVVDQGQPLRCEQCGGPLVQRADDDATVVLSRLRIYQERTRPVVHYYRNRVTFRAVDGMLPPDRVTDAVAAAVAAAEDVTQGGRA